jgi:hypothetical protein
MCIKIEEREREKETRKIEVGWKVYSVSTKKKEN